MSDSPDPPARQKILATARDYIEQLVEEGLEGLPAGEGKVAPQAQPSPLPQTERARSPLAALPQAETAPQPALMQGQGTRPQAASLAPAAVSSGLFSPYPGLDKTAELRDLREFIGECDRCKLAPGRTNLVFGVGDPRAELMFVGEGPGADEDAAGEPFVGRAGQLLTDIIERGMKMKRSQVYICNVVKCRPPGNRNPEPDEVAACEPFLMRQIELVNPKVIVGLGTFAVQSLLRVKTPISKLRGIWHNFRGVKLMPTFHPAYLLRNPYDKRLVWSDIQEVMKALDLPIEKRGSP